MEPWSPPPGRPPLLPEQAEKPNHFGAAATRAFIYGAVAVLLLAVVVPLFLAARQGWAAVGTGAAAGFAGNEALAFTWDAYRYRRGHAGRPQA